MNKKLFFLLGGASVCSGALAGTVVFDNTLPGQHGPPTALTPVSGTYTIDSVSGYLTGKNLFQSFLNFSIDSGQTALFTNSLQVPIGNVISRVTGGVPSAINGTITSQIFLDPGTNKVGANFWFVNPAGVTFGKGAAVNVPAGLAIAAADYLSFADGSRFYALPSHDPTGTWMITASPAAFGFLPTPASGAVVLQGNSISTTAPITLSAGPGGITLTDSSLTTTNSSGLPGSTSTEQLAISSAGGAVVLQSSNVLTTNAPVQSLGQTASAPANITISGDTIAVHGGSVISQTHNGADAGSIALTATSTSATAIQIDGGALLRSQTGSNPNELNTGGSDSGTGPILLRSDSGGIVLSGAAISTITGQDEGNASPNAGQPGSISLSAQQISVAAGSSIEVWANSFSTEQQMNPQGVPYTVPVVPAPISLSASGPISVINSTLRDTSIAQTLDTGDINIAGASVLVNGATLDSKRGYYGSQSGDINITASGATGPAGAQTQEPLLIEGGSTIDANGANGSGNGGGGLFGYAGNIRLNAPSGAIRVANSMLTAENNGGTTSGKGFITVAAGSELTIDSATIQSTTGQAETGGSLPPDSIALQSGGPMSINASTISDVSPNAGGIIYGTGGNVTISAPSVLINGGRIQTTTYGSGAAGSVAVTASGANGSGAGDAVVIKGGASISSDVSGYFDCCGGADLGPAGNITILAPAGSIQIQQSTLSTNTDYGQAGVISLNGASGISLDGAKLLSRVLAGGTVGTASADIGVQSAGPITITNGTSIDSSTNGDAPAGKITITTPGLLMVSGASSLSSTTGGSSNEGPFGVPGGGTGKAGSITLTGGSIDVVGSSISVSTNGEGSANAVTLSATGKDTAAGAALLVEGGALITSDAGQGLQGANAGTVTLTAKNGTVQIGVLTDAAGSPTTITTSVGASGGAAGEVLVTGSAVDLENASVSTTTGSTGPATTRGTIVLDAGNGAGPLAITNSSLDAATSGVQQAGEIDLLGAPILITNSTISSATTSTGSAGSICVGTPGCVAAGLAVPETGGSIGITSSTLSTSTSTAASAGDIQVNGASVSVSGGRLTAATTGSGTAGNVSLTATGASGTNGTAALLVSDGAAITSDASGGSSAQANAGYVSLSAPAGTVQVGLAGDSTPSSLSSEAGANAGTPGAVTLVGVAIDLGDAKVSTTAASTNPGTTRGTIVLVAGNGSGPLTIANSSLDAATSGVQQAGEIDLEGSPTTISNSTISSATTGTGSAGAICVSSGGPACVTGAAPAGGLRAASKMLAAAPAGGGSISISGSTLSTSTSTSGNAGDITVITPGALTLSGTTVARWA
jgi:filamentous hemagglutinin family protein